MWKDSMIIDSIEKGTSFDIIILDENIREEQKYRATLRDTSGDVFLLVEGKALYDLCKDSETPFNMLITFYGDNNKYSFYCRSKSTQIIDNVELTEIAAITGVKKEGRRNSPRFSSTVEVILYKEGKNKSIGPLCIGQADDISYDAICFLTNYTLDTNDDGRFSVEFTLYGKHFFRFYTKLLHSHRAPFYTRYKNAYVFMFDYAGWPDERARLVNVFLEDRIKTLFK